MCEISRISRISSQLSIQPEKLDFGWKIMSRQQLFKKLFKTDTGNKVWSDN